MTRFEQIGADKQYYAQNLNEANRNFERSCTRCATSGRNVECSKCTISFVHDIMVDYFNTKQYKINNKGA